MIRLLTPGSHQPRALKRREMLRIGGVGLGGLSLPTLLGRPALGTNAANSFGKAKSVILFGLFGGVPQHETFDPKPQAPAEIRGDFEAIASRVSGLHVGSLMPRVAQLTDKLAVLRAVSTGDNAHSSSGYQMLTGIPHQPLNRESATAKAPNLWPSGAAITRALCDRSGQLPAAVTVPEHIWNDGNFDWPGQDAGFLGKEHDPWLIPCQPQDDRIDVPGLQRGEDMATFRLDARRSLLANMNSSLARLRHDPAVATLGLHAAKAFDLLCGDGAAAAFDMTQEKDTVRDRYGRSRFSQSVLLSRRLIEAGVRLVQINWTRVKGYENQGGWDTHAKHSKSLKEHLMPVMDQTFSALLEDLEQRGMLGETLVVWLGEFGHTPKFNANAGRDHWGSCFSIAMAGGGIRGGAVHGSSDAHAAYPVDGLVRPKDIWATIFHCLGFHAETEIRDPLGRPLPISRGRVIEEIL